MLRLIVQIVDTGAAANVGGPVETRYRTFDVDLPAVEAELRNPDRWIRCALVGAEVLPDGGAKEDVGEEKHG